MAEADSDFFKDEELLSTVPQKHEVPLAHQHDEFLEDDGYKDEHLMLRPQESHKDLNWRISNNLSVGELLKDALTTVDALF